MCLFHNLSLLIYQKKKKEYKKDVLYCGRVNSQVERMPILTELELYTVTHSSTHYSNAYIKTSCVCDGNVPTIRMLMMNP